MSISLASGATEDHPLLCELLKQVPLLRRVLPGWTTAHLIPKLQAFPDDATDAQVAAALENLRMVLRSRADIDPWLGDIARLGLGESDGHPKAWPWATDLGTHIELSDRTKNRTIVEQARRLVGELTLPPTVAEVDIQAPPVPRPDDR